MGKNRFVADGINVAPRRKRVGEVCVHRTIDRIQISKELILKLASKPLAKAAQIVGISETALKRACRELGFQRWPRQSIDVEIKLEDLVRSSSSGSSSSESQVDDPSSVQMHSEPAAPDVSFDSSVISTDPCLPPMTRTDLCIDPMTPAYPCLPLPSGSIDEDLETLRFEAVVGDLPIRHHVKSEVDDTFIQHCLQSARIARTFNLPDVGYEVSDKLLEC
mmetsp:Transcript_36750/g.73647  ORF Transcript_36750/g.73647 Transcript_36750/m.73647 type:complete len:220 (-) Transcript_36750:33-692(-)|eukprot:CAMPEP_0196726334 /NCGR_PEP_ID=MMETSP1091-20130531/7635_1 /TAXON_ID=302021 /ORGANISM="Rhodomonas sp., Strain CCMP768" /LENGTH=219 /DNA_ID=CAMNT_0042068755 /DNA_START=45 /DNA_END=704 /DNA_ORIENTATION=+